MIGCAACWISHINYYYFSRLFACTFWKVIKKQGKYVHLKVHEHISSTNIRKK